MTTKRERILDIIGISIVLAIFLYWIIMDIYEKKVLKEDYRFTIATIIDRYFPAEGGPDVDYSYYVNNKSYIGSYQSVMKPSVQLHKRYYIKFYPKDPNIANILFDMPVPDSIKEAPDEGWEVLP